MNRSIPTAAELPAPLAALPDHPAIMRGASLLALSELHPDLPRILSRYHQRQPAPEYRVLVDEAWSRVGTIDETTSRRLFDNKRSWRAAVRRRPQELREAAA